MKTLAINANRRSSRGEKTIQALVSAARERLRHASLQELSVAQLCADIGLTTGAFYNAFKGKKEFFKALQEQACADRAQELNELLRTSETQSLPLAEICHRLVRQIVSNARKDEGILRASLLHDRRDEDLWTPFKELGALHKQLLVAHLAPHLRHLPPRERDLRIRFANQAIAALIVHTLINRPGPLDIAEEAFITETSRMMVNYLS